ncbi:MAG TPA: hypothetical protein VHR41_04840 [Gemmatimonadales bacterium]|nr:hypothetical protein [Gemmatimonadales bacterium]
MSNCRGRGGPRIRESEGVTNYAREWWHFGSPLEGAVPFDRVIR